MTRRLRVCKLRQGNVLAPEIFWLLPQRFSCYSLLLNVEIQIAAANICHLSKTGSDFLQVRHPGHPTTYQLSPPPDEPTTSSIPFHRLLAGPLRYCISGMDYSCLCYCISRVDYSCQSIPILAPILASILAPILAPVLVPSLPPLLFQACLDLSRALHCWKARSSFRTSTRTTSH